MPSLREPSYLTTTTTAWPRGVESVLDYNNSAVVLNDLRRLDRIVVTSIGGLSGADLQANAEKNPDRDGEQPLEATYGGRTITLRGYVEAGNLDKLRSLWSYMLDGFDEPTEAPLWMRWLGWRDQFTDSLALSDYAYDAGTGTQQIASDGTGLQPTSIANKQFRIAPAKSDGTTLGRYGYGEGEAIVKFRVGTSMTGVAIGPEFRRASSTVKLRVLYEKATDTLRLYKINTATTQLASVAATGLVVGTDYYIVARADGATISFSLWSSYPPDIPGQSSGELRLAQPLFSTTHTLSAGDQTLFPTTSSGMSWGLYWTPNSTTDRVSMLDVGALNPGDAVIFCRKVAQIESEEVQTDFQWRRDFLLTLRSSDARMVSRKMTKVTLTPPGTPVNQLYYSATLSNLGRSPADYQVVFNGGYFNPRIFFPGSSKVLGLKANVLAANDGFHTDNPVLAGPIEVDTKNRTSIYLTIPQSLTLYQAISPETSWPQLLRGSNELRITTDKFEDFLNSAGGGILNGLVSSPSSMGTWATSGTATDFAGYGFLGYGDSPYSMSRATTADTGSGRFGVLGTATYSDATVKLIFQYTSVPTNAGTQKIGFVVRYTNSTNYVAVYMVRQVTQYVIKATKVVAGVSTDLPILLNLGNTVPLINTWYQIVFVMRSNEGRYDLQFRDPTTDSTYASIAPYYGDIDTTAAGLYGAKDSALATAGTLATGKIGLLDFNPTAAANTRYYGQLLVTSAIDSGTIDIYYRHSSR